MVIRTIIAILIVGMSGVYARGLTANRVSAEAIPDLKSLPRSLDEWQSEDYELSEVTTSVLAADATLQRRYFKADGSEVWLFLAYFAEQQVNSQIHSPKHCVPGTGWTIVSAENASISLPSGPQPATHLFLDRGETAWDMFYWFRTRAGTVTGEYSLKLDLVKNSLLRRPTDAVFIRYMADHTDGPALEELIHRLSGPLDRALGEVGL